MSEMYVLYLLEPVLEEKRLEVAAQLSQRFHIPREKMERRLSLSGLITRPLSKALAERTAEPLLQAGVSVAVVRNNLSDVLIFDQPETITSESLREFLADIPTVSVRTFLPPLQPREVNRSVFVSVLSLLFLILTLTFGVSFMPAPEAVTASYQSMK